MEIIIRNDDVDETVGCVSDGDTICIHEDLFISFEKDKIILKDKMHP